MPLCGTSSVLNCDVQPMTGAHEIGRSWGNGDVAPRGLVASDVVSDVLDLFNYKLPSSALIIVSSVLRMLASSMVA